MSGFVETALAKINLTLRIHGRLPSGYHSLTSLVAFASLGDRLTLTPGQSCTLSVTGPFAADLTGENLVARALEALRTSAPHLQLGTVTLEKTLPIAAGVGGGSADAAALLRAVAAANPGGARSVDWHALARSLGADVPVCMRNRATWMTGIGDRLMDLAQPLAETHIVLVNPQVPVPVDKTAAVFRQLRAAPIGTQPDDSGLMTAPLGAWNDLVYVMDRSGNDLEGAAIAVVPEIARVLTALRALPGLVLARLSGAGPTCFGVCRDGSTAADAARTLADRHPGWWVRAAQVS